MQHALIGSRAPACGQGRQGRSARALAQIVRAQADPSRSRGPLDHVKAALRKADVAHSAAVVTLGNVLLSLPAHAEPGKIFDFNATLPVMAFEFLALMVFLDKFWFGPVGKVLDKRDAMIRDMLADTKDNKEELDKLQKEAEDVVSKARQEAQKEIQAAQKKAEEENAEELEKVKERIDKELNEALATLEKEKEDALKNLDTQVDKLASEILSRVLPKGVKV